MRPTSSFWLLLGAIATEVAATLALRASDGFTRPLPTAGTLLGYALSLCLFALAMAGGRLSLGVGYATLAGVGLVAATVASTWLFGDPLGARQLAGLVVLGIGVVVVQLSGPAPVREPG